MQKWRAVVRVVVGALLILVAFYLGSEVFPGALGIRAEDGIADEASRDRSAAADAFASWGITAPDNIDEIEVTTPENAPLEYVALQSGYLVALAEPTEGRAYGVVEGVDGDYGLSLRAQSFEVIDESARPSVIRSAATPVTVRLEYPGGASSTSGQILLRAGEPVRVTFTLEPTINGGPGRLVVQTIERMSDAGGQPSN